MGQNEWWLHCDAKWSIETATGTGGKFRQVFAAVVIQAVAGANDKVLRERRGPGQTDARSEAPFATREPGIAHALGRKLFVVSANYDTCDADHTRTSVARRRTRDPSIQTRSETIVLRIEVGYP